VEQWIENVFPKKAAVEQAPQPGESPEEMAAARKEMMMLSAAVMTTLFCISGMMVSTSIPSIASFLTSDW